jgi:outer membrane protein assembly factor BamB
VRLLRYFLALPLLACAIDLNLAGSEDLSDLWAQSIIKTAGIDKGLCIHLGAGNDNAPGLTAALAKHSHMLIHGLTQDTACLARAQLAVQTANVCGQAMLECVPWKPLPYLPNLANLVVIDGPAAEALTNEDVLAIVQPNGLILRLENDVWKKTVKLRPQEMDEWSHPRHGADGNLVSRDKYLTGPVGLRWIDGIPSNASGFSATRAWVTAGGRLFTLGVNEAENANSAPNTTTRARQYISARDAFNGLPLWKVDCGADDNGTAVGWNNGGPLCTDGERVYGVVNGKPVILDAASGRLIAACETKYPIGGVLLDNGILVALCWEEPRQVLMRWKPGSTTGVLAAFDARTGAPRWSIERSVYQAFASDGTLYLNEPGQGDNALRLAVVMAKKVRSKGDDGKQVEELRGVDVSINGQKHAVKMDEMGQALGKLDGNIVLITGDEGRNGEIIVKTIEERTNDIAALNLADGVERWRVPRARFEAKGDLQINCAGPDFVSVIKGHSSEGLVVLSAKDGSELWRGKIKTGGESTFVPLVNGEFWYGGNKLNAKSGKIEGRAPNIATHYACHPSVLAGCVQTVDQMLIDLNASRKDAFALPGIRSACVEGLVPANGLIYTAQNQCRCFPGAVFGFLGLGNCGQLPATSDFERAPKIENGPAFGAVPEIADIAKDWPMLRHDAERSGTTTALLPAVLKESWRITVVNTQQSPLAAVWGARLTSCLSAPVISNGAVFVSAVEQGQVIALDAVGGERKWTVSLGSRLDSPPTVSNGLCLIGCHDGYLYALRATDGVLVWRSRVAPFEKRMMVQGQLESVWPVYGSAIVREGLVYVSAGRSSESDGGVVIAAFALKTGEWRWSKHVAPGASWVNDVLAVRDELIAWNYIRLDPKSGAFKTDNVLDRKNYGGGGRPVRGGLLDGIWTRLPCRRSGSAFQQGRNGVSVNLMSWNAEVSVSAIGAFSANAETPKWTPQLPRNYQVEAIAMAKDKVVLAGRIKGPTPKKSGFLWMLDMKDGKKLFDMPLECPPAYDGLANAQERVYLSLEDGTLLCLAKTE